MRKELLRGEQVIMITRQQPRMLFGPVLAFILVPAAAAFACAWIVKGGPGKLLPLITSDWTQWLVAACLAIVAIVLLGYSLPRFVRWRAVRYILTSGRIVARFGMLRRGDWQVPLAAVRSVGIEQSLLQRILRSGNISLDTGHPGSAVLADVPEVGKFRSFILDAMAELPTSAVFGPGAVPGPGDDGDFAGPIDYSDSALPWEMREGGRDER
ncbi:PH domain-containing protein [Arthrobacter bambusae]|uniref:PH domain-containing protein n=1 Tax=Arthrobacter bambusae TaxID=1338426 RepID=UPI00278944E8|nr:PH domain-containing protein [Arthrobacter bambusae]MDQ0029173.1 membrane protein YdbS with pleckstrin-like domain [Arthrobacter bambusae]MDQ0098082.1 membrane protein YdbS with pleckstrin-like domain [Arthrobacter bambusae]